MRKNVGNAVRYFVMAVEKWHVKFWQGLARGLSQTGHNTKQCTYFLWNLRYIQSGKFSGFQNDILFSSRNCLISMKYPTTKNPHGCIFVGTSRGLYPEVAYYYRDTSKPVNKSW